MLLQCGQNPCPEVSTFTLIRGPWPGGEKVKIVKAGAGVSFSVLLSDVGKRTFLFIHCMSRLNSLPVVYALGSAEHGQLGNGRTGETIATGNKTTFDSHAEPSKLD